jgi:aspartyl-tRNA(Asn)/glutamyl-tRNA(Gln) amidotransferase subunit A
MTDALAADATALEIANAVHRGAATAGLVVEATLARIAARNPVVNAFTALVADRARNRAARVDTARACGSALGPLAGVPFGVKAMIDIAGVTTTAGSALHRHSPVAVRDAAVVRKLEAAGAICVGALNMDEFGLGGTTENALYGPTRNPHDRSRTAGGSSGGCAAALAAGLVPLAVGGDALGSIRLPASLCGVYGLRPTRGVVSREGVMGGGGISTLGAMGRSAADVRLCHDVMRDRRSTDADAARMDAADAGNLRVGRAGGEFRERLNDDAAEAVDRVARALRVDRVVDFPHPRLARAAAMLINTTESALGHLDALRTRLDEFDPATRNRFLAHALMPAQWYLHAQRFREWHIGQVLRMFESVDVVVLPATPCTAPPLGTPTLTIADVELPTGPTLGWFTQPLAGTDCPALTVPIARPGRLPIGVQLFAPPHREEWLVRVALRLEALGIAASPIAALEVPAPGRQTVGNP